MPDDQRNIRNVSFPLLVAVANKDHQLLIQYGLLASMPQAKTVFVTTASETITYLTESSAKSEFPRLVLMDIQLPTVQVGFQLVTEIKKTYPCLPVIAISSDPDEDIIRQAYELGIHSFLLKPVYLEEWEHYFRIFNAYWSGVVTLPSGR